MESFITVTSFIIGIVSFIVSLYFSIKTKKLEAKISRFRWEDVDIGITELARQSKDFDPEVILIQSGGAGGIVGNLYLVKCEKYIPIIYGNEKKTGKNFTADYNTKYHYTTSKWDVYFPNELELYKDKRILVILDAILNGDNLEKTKLTLKECGYLNNNIKVAALFVSPIAWTSNKRPDFYWYKLNEGTEYYYPWGKVLLGKGYEHIN